MIGAHQLPIVITIMVSIMYVYMTTYLSLKDTSIIMEMASFVHWVSFGPQYIFTCTCMHTCTCIHTCTFIACRCMRTYTPLYIYMYAYRHMYACTYECMQVHIYVCIYACTCTFTQFTFSEIAKLNIPPPRCSSWFNRDVYVFLNYH